MGLLKYYRIANLLSLDVVAGSVCCALFFARLSSKDLNTPVLIALGLTVWIVYTTDHLLDSQSSRNDGSNVRRAFHQMHRRSITIALGICVALLGVTLFWLPPFTLIAGIVLAVAVGVYILLQKRIWWLKEFLVSVLYTAGVVLPSAQGIEFSGRTFAFIGAFFLIALINLLIFSWYDHDRDKAGGHFSAVTSLGRPATRMVIWVLIGTTALSIALSGFGAGPMILLVMLVLHLGIFLFEGFFAAGDRYRLFGDAIFLLPGILIFFP